MRVLRPPTLPDRWRFSASSPCLRSVVRSRPQRPAPLRVRAAQRIEVIVPGDEGGPPLREKWDVPEGRCLVTVSLRRPLGLVLEERDGRVIAAEVESGGHGAAAGVRPGDVLRGVTARSQDTGSGRAGGKAGLLGRLVLFNADDESFDTVLAAIRSSRCSQCDVVLVLERQGVGAGA